MNLHSIFGENSPKPETATILIRETSPQCDDIGGAWIRKAKVM